MSQEQQREIRVKSFLALCALRKEATNIFFRYALSTMDDDQVCILLQQVVEWIAANPPKPKPRHEN